MEHFGQMLRRLREERGMSLRQLAKVAGIDFGYVGQIERGERRCSAEWAKICDQTLDAHGVLLDHYRATVGVPARKGATVRRRAFMGSMGVLALGASSPMVALEAIRHGLALAATSSHDEWHSIAQSYITTFYVTPLARLVERLAIDLTVLEHQLVDFPDDIDLHRAGGQMSTILAIALTSAGQTWMARRWWDTARALADKSGDLDVRVMARSQDAVKGLYDGRPLSAVLDLADETVALAPGRACAGTAGVLAAKAQALATAGRADEAKSAISEVERTTERMPAEILADETLFGWPEHRLRHTESFVFTEIGDTARAMVAQDRALALYPTHHHLNRSLVQMHRASCLIQRRNIAEGLRYAADVLDTVPVEMHDALLAEMARRVVAVVPEREREHHRTEMNDLRERISTPTLPLS